MRTPLGATWPCNNVQAGLFQEIRFYVDLVTIKMMIMVVIMLMIMLMIMVMITVMIMVMIMVTIIVMTMVVIMVLMTTGLQRSRVLSRISFARLSFP